MKITRMIMNLLIGKHDKDTYYVIIFTKSNNLDNQNLRNN